MLIKRRTRSSSNAAQDGGRTWGPLAIIADGGERSFNNPCAVVERESGNSSY